MCCYMKYYSYKEQETAQNMKYNPIPENADKTNTKNKIQSITKIFFIAYRFHIYGAKFGIQVEAER